MATVAAARQRKSGQAGAGPYPARQGMFNIKKKRHGLYYMLPGMNHASRRRARKVFWVSVLIGLLVSALIGLALWWFGTDLRRF